VANIQLLQGTEKIKDSYGKINDAIAALNLLQTDFNNHITDVAEHVSLLSENQYTAAEPVTSYPMGLSIMRVTGGNFSSELNANGTVVTIKGTSGVGFQIFASSTSNIGTYFRGSTNEVWKKWEPVVKSGTTLWSGNAYQAGTILNLSGNLNDFSYLIVIVDLVGYETRLIYHKESSTYEIKGFNLVNDGVTPTLAQAEIGLSRTSDTSLTIDRNLRWRWTGNAADNATMFLNDSGFNIRKIIGVV